MKQLNPLGSASGTRTAFKICSRTATGTIRVGRGGGVNLNLGKLEESQCDYACGRGWRRQGSTAASTAASLAPALAPHERSGIQKA